MKANITNWEARPSRLYVSVVAEPLGMSKRYVWAKHTNNQYGQGSKWAWWHMNTEETPTTEVFSAEAQSLLRYLVHNHNVLGKLAPHYYMVEGELPENS